jgi:aminopeptidase N
MPSGKPLTLDFRGYKISSYNLNGEAVTDEDCFINHEIKLPNKNLKLGLNKLSLCFINKYRIDGSGFHSFIDPSDQEQYIYTQFSPDNCHWFFPVFD